MIESEDKYGALEVYEVLIFIQWLYVYVFPRFFIHSGLCGIFQTHLVVHLQNKTMKPYSSSLIQIIALAGFGEPSQFPILQPQSGYSNHFLCQNQKQHPVKLNVEVLDDDVIHKLLYSRITYIQGSYLFDMLSELFSECIFRYWINWNLF